MARPTMQPARAKHLFILSLTAAWILALSMGSGNLASSLMVAAADSPQNSDWSNAATVAAPTSGHSGIENYTPQEAYDKAMSLLSSVLAPIPSSGRTSGSSTSSPTSLFSPYWEALTSWTPLGTILRIFYRVQDILNKLTDRFSIGRSSSSSHSAFSRGYSEQDLDPNVNRNGNGGSSADTSKTGTYEPSAAPEQVWPNWEDELKRDSIFFGPFVSSSYLENLDLPSSTSASLLSLPIVKEISDNLNKKYGNSLILRKFKDLKDSPIWKGQNQDEKKLEIKSRIEEAQRLLEFVGFESELQDDNQSNDLSSARDLIADILRRNKSNSTSIPTSSSAGSRFHNPFKRSPTSQSQTELPSSTSSTTFEYDLNSTPSSRLASDALWVLAEHFLWGTHGIEPDFKRAKKCYQRLSAVTQPGNATAHSRLALLEGGAENGERAWNRARKRALGLQDGNEEEEVIEEDEAQNQAKALLHYTIAARNGDHSAQMALGFRYKAGIGSPVKDFDSLLYYEKAAQAAHEKFMSGPPGGLTLPYTKLRLSDLSGGVYGPGASVASTGWEAFRPAIQAVLKSQPAAGGDPDPRRLEDMLEYYTYHADHGSAWFLLTLGKIYYQGSVWAAGEAAGAVPRDFLRSRNHFLKITKEVWPADAGAVRRGGPNGFPIASKGQRGYDVTLPVEDNKARHAASAASYLGKMYLRGEGVRQDFNRAWVWFHRGVEKGDPECFNGMGLMFRDGLGVPRDMTKATHYFEAAATSATLPSADGCVNYGKIHYDMGDLQNALKYFDRAVHLNSAFEGNYYIGLINSKLARDPNAIGREQRVKFAVRAFKQALERGDWESPVFHLAAKAWKKGDRHKALLGWMIAAERGYEAAQNNVAWILDRDKKSLRIAAFDAPEDSSTDRLALIQWTRSAGQDNIDALVKAGDYYFHGYTNGPDSIGVAPPSYEKAVACYQAAADRQVSALAYWNMGWMYETGHGVPRRDFPLAKRYYDMALAINKEAMLAVYLSLARLYLRASWAAANFDPHAIAFLERGLPINDDGIGYTEAEERALAENAGKNKNLDPDEGMDFNLPETYDRRGDRNRGETRLDRETGEAIGGGEEEIDLMIEAALICVGLAALIYLVSVRHALQLRVDRQRREIGQTQPQQQQQQQQQAPQQGEIGGPNAPFPWPAAGANQVAGL